jgi:hypothetical protein
MYIKGLSLHNYSSSSVPELLVFTQSPPSTPALLFLQVLLEAYGFPVSVDELQYEQKISFSRLSNCAGELIIRLLKAGELCHSESLTGTEH